MLRDPDASWKESLIDLSRLRSLQYCGIGGWYIPISGDRREILELALETLEKLNMSFTKNQLLPGENLVLLARQHRIILFKPVCINAGTLAILIALSVYAEQPWFLCLFAIPLVYLIWKILSWHRKEYILTDRRVVLQEGVLSISSFDASLDKINNVYHSQSVLGRMLNYGDVGLETASEAGTTTFQLLSKPLSFKNSIVRQRELYRMDYASAGKPLPPNIPQLLEELASLRDRNIISESEFQDKKRALLQKI